MNTLISLDLLLPVSKAMLLGTFSYSLMQAVRGEEEMSEPFEGVIIALIGLSFYKPFNSGLTVLSAELVHLLKSSTNGFDVKTFLIEAMHSSIKKPVSGVGSIDLTAMAEQALRAGVWGVMTQVSEFCFLTVGFLIECSQSILSKLLMIIFPVGCALYPLAPEILKNLVIYAFELALWMPVLTVIEVTSGEAARSFVTRDGSWGLYIIATELVTICLTLCIPHITHKFLAGALSSDMGSHGAMGLAKKWIAVGNQTFFRGGA